MRCRVLQITDIHASQKGLNTLTDAIRSEKPDIVVVCGDITHFGPYSFAEQIFKGITLPVISVLGNCDLPDTFEKIHVQENIVHIHGKTYLLGDVKFAGFGGANGTPWAYGNLYTEEEIYSGLNKIVDNNTILVTHTPPVSFVNANIGERMGSEAVDRIIAERKPVAVLCGHIHEASGVYRGENGVLVVNPGPAKHGKYGIIEIESGKVEAWINED